MSERGISSAVIRRLPRYYRYLGELLENNVVRISSKELSIRMKVTASQIRRILTISVDSGSRATVITSNISSKKSGRFSD